MKLITAIVRPEKLDELIPALTDQGVRGLTVTDVRGFGVQYGNLIGAAARVTGPRGGRMAVLLAKVRLDLVVLDDDAETIVEVIAKHAVYTGSTVATSVLSDWPRRSAQFTKIMPTDYQRVLQATRMAKAEGRDVDTAIMEASRG